MGWSSIGRERPLLFRTAERAARALLDADQCNLPVFGSTRRAAVHLGHIEYLPTMLSLQVRALRKFSIWLANLAMPSSVRLRPPPDSFFGTIDLTRLGWPVVGNLKGFFPCAC